MFPSVTSFPSSFALLLCAAIATTTFAQTFPTKPVRIVTGGAGGVLDLSARLIAQGLTEGWGQQVIVENRPTGVMSPVIVSKAQPDGYTLLLSGNTLWIIPLLQEAPFDPWRDFVPVTFTVKTPNVLVVHPSVAAASVRELIALAKARAGELNYGTSGAGTGNYLAAEMFKAMAGLKIVRVSYKSPGAALTDLIAGNVQIMFATAPTIVPHSKSGRLRALAVTSANASALTPGLPTMSESGLPGYEVETLNGLFAPARTSAALVKRLHEEIARVLARPDIREKLFSSGVEVVAGPPAALAAAVKGDHARMAKLVKEAGLRND